ncbi:hypothetical protein OU800_15515 [Pseudomonas sp. GOM7]|uniref:hypothetical protein n=1 Tax=Pseudomonas sp. GOM7 TaxID=2998079 RepID=UPI00227AED21|nr:hypothetical protein [Pseudomonas sp. GOM7]WAJ36022.1 hypothetical protein OU800_15515 [Pseudomonas sp. GOM7]
MFISVGKGDGALGAGLSISGGVFDCVVEETRRKFKDDECFCMKEIYRPLDEQGQNFIVLDYVDECCFNLFYAHCKKAMEEFSLSERAKLVPERHIPGILWNWSEVLRGMREDARYRA